MPTDDTRCVHQPRAGSRSASRLAADEVQRDVQVGHQTTWQKRACTSARISSSWISRRAGLDTGAVAREEGVVRRRRAVGGTDARGNHDGHLPDLLAGAPVDDAAGHVGVSGHESLGALPEDGVDGPREADVGAEVIRDQSEKLVLAARPLPAGAGFEHTARSARQILQLAIPVEEGLHAAAVARALDVCGARSSSVERLAASAFSASPAATWAASAASTASTADACAVSRPARS